MPGTIHAGTEAKFRTALPAAVVLFVAALPPTCTRAYEPPLTSVKPVPSSAPDAVNSAMKTEGRAGCAVRPAIQFISF